MPRGLRLLSAGVRLLWPPLLLVAMVALSRVRPELALALIALWPALFSEVLYAEYRGWASPWMVVWAAGWALVPWGLASVMLSMFVPIAVWLLAVGGVYGIRGLGSKPGSERPVGQAWREASELFRGRRVVLGRHYRWRVALAALPHMLYLFSLYCLLLGIAVGILGTAGLAAGSPETAALGLFFSTLIIAFAVLLALPGAFGLVGVLAAPWVRGPYAALLRALMDEDWEPIFPRKNLKAGLAVLALDLVVYAVAFFWAGATFIGSAFPMGGSMGALILLPLMVGVLAVRMLVADAMVLEEDRPFEGARRMFRAVGAHPLSFVEMGLWQLLAGWLVLGLPLLVVAAISVAMWQYDLSIWAVLAFGLIGLVGILRLAAAAILRLALHRLVLLRASSVPRVAARALASTR